jgi:hypothetical protein
MKEISNQALKEEKRTKIIKSTASIYCHQAEVIVTVHQFIVTNNSVSASFAPYLLHQGENLNPMGKKMMIRSI